MGTHRPGDPQAPRRRRLVHRPGFHPARLLCRPGDGPGRLPLLPGVSGGGAGGAAQPAGNVALLRPQRPRRQHPPQDGPRKLNRAANIDKATATAALPPNQIVRLGKKLRLGDLEIEPLNVDREVVSVMVHAGDKPQPCPYPSLVLTLKLRNVSDNVVFQPMDPYFDRRWEPKKGNAPPLTILEMPGKGKEQFLFGGPANYQPPPKSPEWVVRPERGEYDLGDTSRQIQTQREAVLRLYGRRREAGRQGQGCRRGHRRVPRQAAVAQLASAASWSSTRAATCRFPR